MRTKPLIGRKAWFGPKRTGWGLAPVSPEGWAVPLVAVGAIACVLALAQPWIALVVAAAMIIVIFLKSTSPGGRQEWEEYQAQKDRRDALAAIPRVISCYLGPKHISRFTRPGCEDRRRIDRKGPSSRGGQLLMSSC